MSLKSLEELQAQGDKCDPDEEENEELLSVLCEHKTVSSECRLSDEKLMIVSKDGENSKDKEERLPDGGWGWVVVFGTALILVLVDTIGQCFGIIFSRFLLDLETPTATTAWIFNLFSFVWCVTGPPLGPLIKEFGWRTLTFIGSLMLAMATITSAFASAAWVLFFTYSILAGYVRDITQSYLVCIWVLSGAVFLAFLLWLCMPAAVAYDLHREQNRKMTKKEAEEERISQSSHA